MSSILNVAQNYTLPASGLYVWTNIAKAIRVSMRNGQPSIPLSGGFSMSPEVISYVRGAAILIAVIFLSFLFVLVGSLLQCCCLCCNKKSIIRKQRTRVAGPVARTWAWIMFSLVSSVFFVGAITSFSGSAFLSTSVTSANNGTLSLLNNTKKVFINLTPTLNQSFATLKSILNNTVDDMTTLVNFDDLVPTGVTPNLTLLADSMEAAQVNIDSLKVSGTNIKARKNASSVLVDSIVTAVTQIDTDVQGLTSSRAVPSNANLMYRLTNGVTTGSIVSTANSAKSGISNSADGDSTFASLANTPNLVTYATEVRNTVTGLRDNVAKLIRDGGSNVKGSLGPSLDKANDALVTSLNPATSSIVSQLDSAYSSVQGFFNMYSSYDLFRAIALPILSSFILVILVTWSVAAYCAKPKAMKGCNLCATPLYLLIQILALILFIIAYVLSEGCNAVFETSPPAIGGLDANLNKTLVNVQRSRALCSANGSLLDVAVAMALVDADSVNISAQAKKKIDEVDFSGISNFNVSSSISLSDNPTNKLSTVSNLDLSSLNTTALDDVTTNTLPSLNSSLTTLQTALTTLLNNVAPNELTFTPSSPTPAVADQASALDDLKNRLTGIISNIGTLTSNSGTISQLSGNLTSTAASINSTVASANSLKGNVSIISSYYNASMVAINAFSSRASQNVTVGIPVIKDNVVVKLQQVDRTIQSGLSCYDIADSLNNVQDALCGQFVGGLDAVWLAYFFIGVFAAVAMPTIIYFANVRIAHKHPRVDPAEYDPESKAKNVDQPLASNVVRSAPMV